MFKLNEVSILKAAKKIMQPISFSFLLRKKFILSLLFALCILQMHAQQNVILIIADDLGTDYCGFYPHGQDTANMPNIRGLLSKGVQFKNAWATPYCSSTRSSILTGRYPFRTGVGTVISGAGSADLDSTEISFAKLLKYSAPTKYATAHIGKWHMNIQTPQKILYPTTKFGYDFFQGNFQGAITDYYNWTKITNGLYTTTVTNYATTETVNDAINWLDTLSSGKPFFMWLAFNAPHSPYHLPPASLHTIPGLTGTAVDISQHTKKYFMAMIEAMDTETGRLLQYLTAHNLMDSTNIIFIGDNGNDKRIAQIADTVRAKGTLYDYGIQVPFIVSGPAVVNPNRMSDTLINTPDIFATVLDLAGYTNWPAAIPLGKVVDSKSLLPVIKNQSGIAHPWIFSELFTPTPTPQDGKAIRNKEYKLIQFDDGHQEFYKVVADTFELNNLLLQNLTAADISNYYELCNALSNLVGTNACQTGVGVENYLIDNQLLIYPNPFQEKLNMTLKYDADIYLYDVTGREYDHQSFHKGRQSISTKQLTKGMYILQLKNEYGIVSKKIVKE